MFVAEIVGDKLLYTTGVLAARYRTLPITLGMAGAFMAKMGVAVLVGEAISRLPPILVASITAISFLTSGAISSLRPSRSPARIPPSGHRDQASEGFVMAGGICARTLEESNRSAADDALDLVRMDDDGGWQMARPPA